MFIDISGNIGPAFVLTIIAGLSTGIGSAIAYFIKKPRMIYLSFSLGCIAEFIRKIDAGIPWHVTGFYPSYKLNDISPTSAGTLRKAVEVGRKAGLEYVYQGNINEGENTYCPQCGKLLVKRDGFSTTINNVKNGDCPYCGKYIVGIGMGRNGE